MGAARRWLWGPLVAGCGGRSSLVRAAGGGRSRLGGGCSIIVSQLAGSVDICLYTFTLQDKHLSMEPFPCDLCNEIINIIYINYTQLKNFCV